MEEVILNEKKTKWQALQAALITFLNQRLEYIKNHVFSDQIIIAGFNKEVIIYKRRANLINIGEGTRCPE